MTARRVILDISTMSKLAILLSLERMLGAFSLEITVLLRRGKSLRAKREEFEEAKRKNEIHQPTIQIFTGVHG